MLSVFPLLQSDPRSWQYLPAILDRVETFAREYEPDEDPATLRYQVQVAFAAAQPGRQLIAVVKDGQLVGHVLVSFEQHGTEGQRGFHRWATIQQMAFDRGSGVTHDLVADWVEVVKDAARQVGATDLRARVKDEARVRAFRRYGFKPTAILLSCEIGANDGR